MDMESKYKKVEKINQSVHDFWNDLPLEIKQAINKAKSELDRGEGIPHEEAMAEIKRSFLKN